MSIEIKDVVAQIEDMIQRFNSQKANHMSAMGALAETLEFIGNILGQKSSFYKTIAKIDQTAYDQAIITDIVSVLDSLKTYIQAGNLKFDTIVTKIRVEVVSEILEQASVFLNSEGVHPASPTVLIGAALEEYLRKWVEKEELSLENRKPGIDNYAKVLRENEKISAQDIKDITSWAGLRNYAAHGKWEEVSDKKRISIMLEGVNLFMRQTNIGGENEP